MEKRAKLVGALVAAALAIPASGALAADMQRSQDRIHQDSSDRMLDRDTTRDRSMDRDMSGDRSMDRDMTHDRTMDRDTSGARSPERGMSREQAQGGTPPGGGMQAQERFQDLDQNGDGVISREELRAQNQVAERLQNRWQQADANGDGQVDRAEFAQFEQQEGQPPAAGGAGPSSQ